MPESDPSSSNGNSQSSVKQSAERPAMSAGRRPPLPHRRSERRRSGPFHFSDHNISWAVLPTLITLGNLVSGFAAIHYASLPSETRVIWGWTGLTLAGLLVFVGMFFDAIDGSIARLTRTSSPLGAQLDSLCDLVTFGIAPAFMTIRLVSAQIQPESDMSWIWVIGPEVDSFIGRAVWAIAAVFVCCAALRLAKFNIESGMTNINTDKFFVGLPSPGAAGAVASLVILHQHLLVTKFPPPNVPLEFVQWSTLVIPAVMLLAAIGMVSNIPYVHVANQYLSGSRSFAVVARLVIALFFAVWWLQETLAICLTVYAVSGPAILLWRRRRGNDGWQARTESSSP